MVSTEDRCDVFWIAEEYQPAQPHDVDSEYIAQARSGFGHELVGPEDPLEGLDDSGLVNSRNLHLLIFSGMRLARLEQGYEA